ncbi:DNA/RNA non-specific endonuclease [Paenibacillus sp. O199]|uniref:DNA/RNA non-specific endonuclease n=2 Tax=Paenibacillus TaxID=44249 RepID=UPI00316AC0DA
MNIDGNELRDHERVSWRFDPRIDQRYQCGNELYKDNNIDRGHLVRRRDPIWGNDSHQANEDTFHFTNCSPQHKNFNQGKDLWLGLEDYLLNHVRNNKREASVFTGPVFRENDIVYRGVKIPEDILEGSRGCKR